MIIKYFIPLLTSILVPLSLTPAWGESHTTSDITFACEENQGIPITVARDNAGTTHTIFHWKQEALPHQTIPQEVCHQVTEKLNNYVVQSHNLSELWINPSTVANLPVICANQQPQNCEVILFIFPPSEVSAPIAHKTLANILDQKMLDEYTYEFAEFLDRPSLRLKLNFFQLFKKTKEFSAYSQPNYQQIM